MKFMKYLKKYSLAIIFVLVLLFLQAQCDLSLPEYTSRIVNVGIQQNGIEKAVPEVIRESELNKIFLFINDEQKSLINDSYKFISKDTFSKNSSNSKKYPELKNNNLYVLKDGADVDKLLEILEKPFMFVSLFNSDTEQSKAIKDNIIGEAGDADIYMILETMPSEAKEKLLAEADKQFKEMPDMLVTQAGIYYVKSEYEAIGIDVGKIQTNYIFISGLKMLSLALFSMVLTILVAYISAKVSSFLARDLRRDIYSKVVSFSNNEMKKFSTASLITRSTNDVTQIQMLFVILLRMVFYAPFMAIGGIIKVMNTNNSMTWIIVVAVMSLLTLIGSLFIIAFPKFNALQGLIDKLNLVTREFLTGLPVIRAFSRHKHEENRFDKANKNLMKTQLFVNYVMAFMMPVMMLIMNGITILIVWVASNNINDGVMQVGDMMAFMQYAMQIIMSFLFIAMISIMLPRAVVSGKRISEVLSTKMEIRDPKKPLSFDSSKKGYVEFKNVCFRYPDADYDVLTNISFVSKPGEITALIGSTGSGKSTVINLIPRFFDVSAGKISVDGVDVRDVKQHDLRAKIGFVPQKGVLFSGTIESNVKYGNKNASEEEVKEALSVSQSKFVDDLEEGINYAISQGGNNVSGGQKQRLSIARAIAVNPDIYIFDDSFSALDFKTDANLRKALKKITKDKTVMIVAQRISTIMNADQIIVLDEGKIVGVGKHKELLENCEVYNQIALSQLSAEEV